MNCRHCGKAIRLEYPGTLYHEHLNGWMSCSDGVHAAEPENPTESLRTHANDKPAAMTTPSPVPGQGPGPARECVYLDDVLKAIGAIVDVSGGMWVVLNALKIRLAGLPKVNAPDPDKSWEPAK